MKHCSRPSRYNSLTLIKPIELTSRKQLIFLHKVINNWDDLPDNVVMGDKGNMVKKHADFFWKDKDLNMKKNRKEDNVK